MKQIALSIILLFAISLSSCKKDPFEDYQGKWSGTYSGQATGTWNVTVDILGNMTGTAATDLAPTVTFPMTGTVTEEGVVTASINMTLATVEFTGQITDGTMSGTWKNDALNYTGDWTGTKSEE